MKPTLIALPTVLTPHLGEPDEIIAVAALTPERATAILRQMKAVTALARRWVGVFRLSSYDAKTIFVPAAAIPSPPEAGDFRVLQPDFKAPALTELVDAQIGIIPGAVIWEARQAETGSLISTTELEPEVLAAIARGQVLNPGLTSKTLAMTLALPEAIPDTDPRWLSHSM